MALALCAAFVAGCAPEKTDADDPNDGINISRFVFRDLDRNGRYDLGERPYAGLEVELNGTGRTPVRRSSNIAGFANFQRGAFWEVESAEERKNVKVSF